jgi:death on curing protein
MASGQAGAILITRPVRCRGLKNSSRTPGTPKVAWRYLDIADYVLIAEAVTGIKAETLADMPRVVNLASSAPAVPASGWGRPDAYPELAQESALLAARLAKDHPLPNANKRVAWLAMIEFIERNGYQLIHDRHQPDRCPAPLCRQCESERRRQRAIEGLPNQMGGLGQHRERHGLNPPTETGSLLRSVPPSVERPYSVSRRVIVVGDGGPKLKVIRVVR